jgi:hypothetical protein
MTAGPPIEVLTLSGVMDDLAGRGYREHFRLAGDRLRLDDGRSFSADQVAVAEYHRFEGVSDPDDMAIIYAIETRNGIRGTLADAFGVYADPAVGRFMKAVSAKAR